MKYWKRILIGTMSFAAAGLSTTLSLAAEPLANEVVSFGQWLPPVDRLTKNPGPGSGTLNELAPKVATIKADGAINFAISGFHNVQVFGDGTTPEDIGTNPPVLPGLGGGIIDISENLIYRGWDPNSVPDTFERDRVEVVHFAEPGTYLVICGVRAHFVNGMFGYVKVLPGKQK
jgi:hypothetical protein